MSARDPAPDAHPSPDTGRAKRGQRPRQQRGGGGSMHMLLGVAIALLLVTTAFAVAVFTGLVSFGQPAAPVESSAAVAQQPGRSQPIAERPPAASPNAAPPAAEQRAPEPEVVKRETFGDWIYTCVESPEGDQVRCAITQHLSDAESRRMIFLWRIVQNGEGGLISLWQTPQAVLLRPGIRLDAGTEEPIVIPYETCRPGLCQASVNLADDFVETLSRTESATATFVTRNGQPVNLTISVSGLADALAALRGPNPPVN